MSSSVAAQERDQPIAEVKTEIRRLGGEVTAKLSSTCLWSLGHALRKYCDQYPAMGYGTHVQPLAREGAIWVFTITHLASCE